jgi:gluconate 2-dehydrogenase alpha chain
MAIRLKKTDVVIIGLGATGGMAALPLARAGLKVIGLEAGPRVSFRDFPSDEVRNDIRGWLGRTKFNHETPTHRLNASQPAGPPKIVIGMVNAVGGTSIHYGMESWRLRPYNFKMRSETIKRYGAGVIPPNSTLIDWPISYADLEPYYDKVEYEIGVSGKAGNIKGKIDAHGNVFEGPRRREFPNPPLRRSGWTELMKGAANHLGWKPFPGPAAILSRTYRGQPSCDYCGFCTSDGCHTNAKGSTFLNAIPAAEKTKNFKVVPLARVTTIVVDRHGRATGVNYVRGGTTYFQPADVVILSAYIYENIRLLLLSKSSAYPNGLSNNHRQVGKNHISHMYGGVDGVFPGRKLNRYSGTGAQRTTTDRWTDDNFNHRGLGFIGGGVLDARMEAKPIATGRTAAPSGARWGSAWKQWLAQNANSIGGVGTQIESLPYRDNFLDLDPTTKDPYGRPVLRVTFDLHDQEKRRWAFLQQKAQQWMKEAGAAETWVSFPATPIAVNSHAYGGARMGNDPKTSVVDKWSMSHEVPNLAILGGATFPTSGNHNPTETIEALAWRTAEHIAKNWKSITA